jgi:phage recombination protein Bet
MAKQRQPVDKIEFTPEQRELIKSQVAPEATEDELKLFLYQCQRTGLDPLARQIYAIHRRVNGKKKMTIQTSIDGFRVIAQRTGEYAGQDEPVWEIDITTGWPISAKVVVYKWHGEQRYQASVGVAFWPEYVQTEAIWENGQVVGQKFGTMWAKMPRTMIAKVAEALALRKAFPQDLSGLYTDDEMAQAGAVEEQNSNVPTTQQAAPTPAPQQQAQLQEAPPTMPLNFQQQAQPVQAGNAAPQQQAPPAHQQATPNPSQGGGTRQAPPQGGGNQTPGLNLPLPLITNEQLKKVIDRIRLNGELMVYEQAIKTYQLSQDQMKELKLAHEDLLDLEAAIGRPCPQPADFLNLVKFVRNKQQMDRLRTVNAQMLFHNPGLKDAIDQKMYPVPAQKKAA